MNQNPYESPPSSNGLSDASVTNQIGRIGFIFALIGCLSLFAIGPFGTIVSTTAMCGSFLSLPGLLISGLSIILCPGRLAGWGIVLGLIGSFYLPTIYITLLGF